MSTPPDVSGSDLLPLLHGLNQPLTAILSNAQAAQRFLSSTLPDRGKLRDSLADIVADDKRAAGIIKRLSVATKAGQATVGADFEEKV